LALGVELDIPTVDGLVTMEVPPGTEAGKIFRIAGRGVPGRSGGRGDQLVTLRAEVPQTLAPRQVELLQEFDRLTGPDQIPSSARYQAYLDAHGSGRVKS